MQIEIVIIIIICKTLCVLLLSMIHKAEIIERAFFL